MRKAPRSTRRSTKAFLPMHVACRKEHLDKAQWLHEQGAAIDVRADDDTEPVHLARKHSHFEIVQWLQEENRSLKKTRKQLRHQEQSIREVQVAPAASAPIDYYVPPAAEEVEAERRRKELARRTGAMSSGHGHCCNYIREIRPRRQRHS